jgi:hypothetical protein
MEKLVQFRDRQELDPADLNGIQTIVRASIDRLVKGAVTDQDKFLDLDLTLTSATTFTVAAGAYVKDGRVYAVGVPTAFNVYENLPVSHRRYIAIVTSGQDDVPDQTEERDYLIDPDSNTVEPLAVSMRSVRQGSVSLVIGQENVDPQMPTIPSSALLVARVLMTTSGIVSYTMEEANRLPSLRKHGERIVSLENFRTRVEPQIGALTTQLATLEGRTDKKLDAEDIYPVYQDLARLKERANLPDDYYNYGSDLFNNSDETDPGSAAGHMIDLNGLHFQTTIQNRNLTLLNPTDPLVRRYDGDWITPAMSHVLMLEVPGQQGDLVMSSYQMKAQVTRSKLVWHHQHHNGFCASFALRHWKKARDYWLSSWAQALWATAYAHTTWWNLYLRAHHNHRHNHALISGYPALYFHHHHHWVPETVYYQSNTTVNHTGAMIAQTFMAPRDFNLSQVGFFLTSLDTSGDVTVIITETKNGKPDIDNVLAKVTVTYADLKSNAQETLSALSNCSLKGGNLYAAILLTQGGHRVATAAPGYTEGMCYYGNDDTWVVTDASRDLKLRFYAQKHTRTRTEVTLGTVVLAGGVTDMTIATEILQPEGTEAIFEVRKNNSGNWIALNTPGLFSDQPDTLELRVVFLGTSDLQPSIKLGNDRVRLMRLGTTLSHLSVVRTLASSKRYFRIDLWVSNHDPDDADQTLTVKLKHGGGYSSETTASAVVDRDDEQQTKIVSFIFDTTTPVTTYKIEITGSRANGAPPYVVLERTDIAANSAIAA